MRALLCLLLLLPLGALAQTPPSVPQCAPSTLGGTGTPLGTWRGEGGLVRSWYCPTPFGWTYHGTVCRPATPFGECPSVTGLSLTDTPAKAWAKAITSDWNAPQWADIMDRARLSIEADMPPPPAYVVAKSGTAATRPVYAFTAGASAPSTGTRGTKKVGDVAHSTPCDCARRVVGSTIYCGVPGGVAACTRKP